MKQAHIDQLDLFAARADRAKAMRRVRKNSFLWFDLALAHIACLRDWVGTGEDLRLKLMPVLGRPHHPNVWGALIAVALERKYLWRTGRRKAMRSARSHARQIDVYASPDVDSAA